jgi:hypothetical protein
MVLAIAKGGHHLTETNATVRLSAAKLMWLERGEASEVVAPVTTRLAMSWNCFTDESRGVQLSKPVAAFQSKILKVFYALFRIEYKCLITWYIPGVTRACTTMTSREVASGLLRKSSRRNRAWRASRSKNNG